MLRTFVILIIAIMPTLHAQGWSAPSLPARQRPDWSAPSLPAHPGNRESTESGINWKTAGLADIAEIDVDARDDEGYTPLHHAARYSETPDIIRTLIDAGAQVNAQTEYGETPLHSAAYNEDPRHHTHIDRRRSPAGRAG